MRILNTFIKSYWKNTLISNMFSGIIYTPYYMLSVICQFCEIIIHFVYQWYKYVFVYNLFFEIRSLFRQMKIKIIFFEHILSPWKILIIKIYIFIKFIHLLNFPNYFLMKAVVSMKNPRIETLFLHPSLFF